MRWPRSTAARLALGGLGLIGGVFAVRTAQLVGALSFIASGMYDVEALAHRFQTGPVEVHGATLIGSHAEQRRLVADGSFYRKPRRLGINPMPGDEHLGYGGNPLTRDADDHARLGAFITAYLATVSLAPDHLAAIADRHLDLDPFPKPVDTAYHRVTSTTWEVLFGSPLSPDASMELLDQLIGVATAGVIDFSLGFYGLEGWAPGPSADALERRAAFVDALRASPSASTIERLGREHGIDDPFGTLFNTFLLTHTGMTRGVWVLQETLVTQPDQEDRLRDSLTHLRRDGPHGDGAFAHAFLLEAFRLRPPIGMAWKVDETGQPLGFHLPAIGRDATRYPDPLRFDPTRDNHDVLAWGGPPSDPRSCRAQDLSKALVLAYVDRAIRRPGWAEHHAAEDPAISYPFHTDPL